MCLMFNSAGNKKAKMVKRGIVTVPLETVAVDLVGPLPKGRRGVEYLFTNICLASRWPEAHVNNGVPKFVNRSVTMRELVGNELVCNL